MSRTTKVIDSRKQCVVIITIQSTFGQPTIYKILHKKLQIGQKKPNKIRGERRCSERVSRSCFTNGTRSVVLVLNLERGNDWDVDFNTGKHNVQSVIF
jgi:hypothetical protein